MAGLAQVHETNRNVRLFPPCLISPGRPEQIGMSHKKIHTDLLETPGSLSQHFTPSAHINNPSLNRSVF
jgi:hypothetical protein